MEVIYDKETDSYYQLDSVEITKFSNNDILYNAFLDIYDGYLVDHNNVGCSNNSKEFDATYLSSRIKNIIGRNTEYTLEDFKEDTTNVRISDVYQTSFWDIIKGYLPSLGLSLIIIMI